MGGVWGRGSSRVWRLALWLSFGLVGVLIAAVSVGLFAASSGRSEDAGVSRARALAAYGRLPLSFVENRGQAPAGVDYVAGGSEWGLDLGRGGMQLALSSGRRSASRVALTTPGGVLRSPVAQQRLPGVANYLAGRDRAGWVVGAPTFARVVYRDVWPGVDMAFHGRQGVLEYDIDLAPGADPGRVALRFAGARALTPDGRGGALVRLGRGTVEIPAPHAAQGAHAVQSRLVVSGSTIRLALGAYEHSKPLVVDPQLVYSTYLQQFSGTAIAVDSAGNTFVASSTVFHGHTPPVFISYTSSVVELSPSGALVYSTNLDGDVAGIAVDSAGDAYISGEADTTSDFPTTPGAYQTNCTNQPLQDDQQVAFVTKLTPAGGLSYSTCLSAPMTNNSGAGASGIAVDSSGDAYVSGWTDPDFPTTAGAYRTTCGNEDAFITKLNPTGSGLAYSTCLVGSGSPSITPTGVAVDSSGDAYLTGSADATNFPTTPGAYQRAGAGTDVGFVTKLNPSGGGLVYSTFLGGTYSPPTAIAVDASGDAYVAGSTGSSDFPTTPSAYQPVFNGVDASNAFVTKFNPDGSGLVYSTYLGATSGDGARAIALDSSGDAYVTGSTGSGLPTTPGAYQTTFTASGNNASDAFVSKLDAAGATLLYSTYLGGTQPYFDYDDTQSGTGIAVDSAGDAYVTGSTSASDFPTTPGAYQTSFSAAQEIPGTAYSSAFAAELNPADVGTPSTPGAGTPSTPGAGTSSSPGAVVSGLRVSPRTFSLSGRRVGGRCVKATRKNRQRPRCSRPVRLRVSYRLNAPARVTFTITRQLSGRLVRRSCVKPTRKNRKRRSCTRLVRMRGSLAVTGKSGSNRFTFNGRIGGHRLGPGRYRLTVTPTINGQAGAAQTVPFALTS